MKNKFLLFLVAIASVFVTSMASAQINPLNNKLGLAVNTPPQNPLFDFDSCFALGQNVGMQEFQLSINWTTLEPTAGTYDFSLIDLSNFYFPYYNTPVNLVLSPINTNVRETPADLSNTAFNSAQMISRYNALLDSIKVHGPTITYSALIIGNEVDVYLGTNATAWAEYYTFLSSTATHALSLWPSIKIATKVTFNGLTNSATATYAQQLNFNCDYIGTTYYPLNNNFTVKPISAVATDFNALVAAYPSKPICFYECGFPSSPTCNSSDSLQKEFVKQVFTTWDAQATHIRMVDFTWLHDLDTATVNYFETYYGISDPIFLEYLRTIGLRTWPGNGTDKPAFVELKCQARQRGYNTLNINCTTGISEQEQTNVEALTVFPNPATQNITIRSRTELKQAELTIYNASGQVVMNISNVDASNVQINTSDFLPGLYLVVLKNETSAYQTKVVVNP